MNDKIYVGICPYCDRKIEFKPCDIEGLEGSYECLNCKGIIRERAFNKMIKEGYMDDI